MKKNKAKKNKLLGIIRRPYIKNQISFSSTLYPNPTSDNSIVSAGASTGFDIKLSTLVSTLGGIFAALWIMSKFKRRK